MEKQIHFTGFSDIANDVLVTAIDIADEFELGAVPASALLVAVCEVTKAGEDVLSELDINFDDLCEAFEDTIKSDGFIIDTESMVKVGDVTFSHLAYTLIDLTCKRAQSNDRLVSDLDLLSVCIYGMQLVSDEPNMINDLTMLTDRLGYTLNEWSEAYYKYLERSGRGNTSGSGEALDNIAEDLTDSEVVNKAKIFGADKYIDECIEVLSRYKSANPCLVGPAGVGKTSIVYGLVQRIKRGEVPDNLAGSRVYYIDGSTLAADTMYRGQFEKKMQSLIKWASDPDNKAILFFDEMHTFMQAGSATMDTKPAANMLKKSLSDGTIRIIGTTTTEEYHKSIETDPAFNRRLQIIEVKEPSLDEAIQILNNSASEYAKFHGVRIGKGVIEAAVKLSNTYMKSRALPDKAYAVLDQACAKAKIDKKGTVTEKMVIDVVSKNTGIDIRAMSRDDSFELLGMSERLKRKIIGQDKAVEEVTKAIKRSRAGVRDLQKPIASFLFVGPTGVGKTELCKQLCKELGLNKESFIRLDMSEYTDEISVSKLIGSAPGYVGYTEGGQLTEKIKHNAYSVVLLDEIEKAHPRVFNVFLQMLDDGRLTDGQGQTVDCTNCIIVMTSNLGFSAVKQSVVGFGATKDQQSEIKKRAVEETFQPEFLNRIDGVVEFNSLGKDECLKIAGIELKELADRVKENRQINIMFDDAVKEAIVKKGYSEKYGARNIKREVQTAIQDELADMLLSGMLNKRNTYTLGINDEKLCVVKKEAVKIKEKLKVEI